MTDATLKVLRGFLDARPHPMSGADFINSIHIFSGTLYPIFERLENAGWIAGQWEAIDPSVAKRPRRKFYELTAIGERQAISALAARGARGLDAWADPIPVLCAGGS